MEKAATGIYTFESLRKGGFTYVGKAAGLPEHGHHARGLLVGWKPALRHSIPTSASQS